MTDLISRQQAIDLVRDVCNVIMSDCDSYYDPEIGDEVYKDILEVDAILKCNKKIRIALRNMPSAERKRGKWRYFDPNGFKCSECGGYLEIECGDVKMNFCPNCGADIRGDDAE